MKFCVLKQIIILILSLCTLANGLDPIGFIVGGFKHIKTQFTECCDNTWIVKNTTGLQNVLNGKLYGQHLVLKGVVNHLKAHLSNKHPSKALALSFHGSTGTGKSYVSKIIAEHVYKEGMKSKYVHLISAIKDFPHKDMVHVYKDQLRNWIETNVSDCSQSMFIFDEIDTMPAGVLDTMQPYLDYYEQLGRTDYRNAIFIFVSNTAGTDIIEYTYKQWKIGVPRQNIKLLDIENIIIKAAFNTNTQTGIWNSELITNNLITAFIPFLPLDKSHVKSCIKNTLVSRGYYPHIDIIPDSLLQEIMTELSYFPEGEEVFSATGCKRVADKVDYLMQGRVK